MNSKAPQPELRIIRNPAVNLTLVSVIVHDAEIVYVTVSESNFGSAHHATLLIQELKESLIKIDKGACDSKGGYPAVKTGSVWQNRPYHGFVTIWENNPDLGKRRSVMLTYDQVFNLLEHFFQNG